MQINDLGVFGRIVEFHKKNNISLNGNESILIFSIISIMEENDMVGNYFPFYNIGLLSKKSGICKTNLSKVFSSLVNKNIVKKLDGKIFINPDFWLNEYVSLPRDLDLFEN